MIIFSSFVTANPVLLYIVRQSVNQSKYILFQSNYTEDWSVSTSSLESFLFPLWYNCYEEALRYLCRMAKPSQAKPSQAKPSQSSNWGRRLARSSSRRPPVC
jgi:hypothetical protein